MDINWIPYRPRLKSMIIRHMERQAFGVKLLGIDANTALLQRLRQRYSHPKTTNPSYSPEGRGDLSLGARPEMIDWLWTRIHSRIPEARRWVVIETATLVHPVSEVIIAFAEGGFYALRLPEESRKVAISAGAKRMSDLGEDWVTGMGEADAEEWWQNAYEHSGA